MSDNNILDIRYIQNACEEEKDKIESTSIRDTEMAKEYLTYTVAGKTTLCDHFINTLEKPRKIPTGIPELSNAIGGGYPVGSMTIIGGVPNVGKTTIAVQSAVNMSKEGIPSVFLSLDMSSGEIVDKIYSQVSYELNGVKGYSLLDIANKKFTLNNDDNMKIIKRVIEIGKYMTVVDMMDEDALAEITEYQRRSMHYEDSMKGTICCLLDIYTKIYDHPVVFIDNLQQLVGFAGEDTGKAGVDKTINFLKKIARQYGIPIVLVSTMGRASYDKTIDLTSFKESGNIDYAVSVAVGLEPKFITDNNTDMNIDDFRENPRRDITIKCVKSRDSGFAKRYVTLNATYCTFEPYDEEHPNNTSTKKKNGRARFVDSVA